MQPFSLSVHMSLGQHPHHQKQLQQFHSCGRAWSSGYLASYWTHKLNQPQRKTALQNIYDDSRNTQGHILNYFRLKKKGIPFCNTPHTHTHTPPPLPPTRLPCCLRNSAGDDHRRCRRWLPPSCLTRTSCWPLQSSCPVSSCDCSCTPGTKHSKGKPLSHQGSMLAKQVLQWKKAQIWLWQLNVDIAAFFIMFFMGFLFLIFNEDFNTSSLTCTLTLSSWIRPPAEHKLKVQHTYYGLLWWVNNFLCTESSWSPSKPDKWLNVHSDGLELVHCALCTAYIQ